VLKTYYRRDVKKIPVDHIEGAGEELQRRETLRVAQLVGLVALQHSEHARQQIQHTAPEVDPKRPATNKVIHVIESWS
jgi:hypothetical protein